MRLPIRGKMILFIGLPVVAIYLVAMIWFIRFAEHQAHSANDRRMEAMAKTAAARFDEYISKAASIADTTARFLQYSPNITENQIFGILTGNVKMNQRIYGAAIAFEPGTREEGFLYSPYVYENRTGKGVIEMNINEEVYDWYHDKQYEWWHRAKNENQGIWTAPYFDEGAGNVIMTTYSVPFKHHGVFAGVTTVDIDLETLNKEVGDSITAGHDFFILAPNGQFIYSPYEGETMNKSIFDIHREEGLSHLDDEAQSMLNGTAGVFAVDDLMDHGDLLVSYAPIPSTGWTFVTTTNANKAMAEFHQRMALVIAAFILALAFTIAAIYLASGRLAHPITRLRQKVLQIANGANDVCLNDIQTGDEIEELAGAFGVMQHKVADREEKLEHARETTLTELLESAPDAMMIVDSQGKIRRSNKQVTEIFGYSRDEIAGMSVDDLMPAHFREGHGKHLAAYFSNPTARQMGEALELSGLRKDGTEFPIEIGLSPFHEPAGLMAVAAMRDITARKEAEARIRKLNQAIEQGSAIVFITDADGDMEYVNPRFTEVTGYSAEEALGQNPRILKSGLQTPAVYKNVWETLADGREWHGEFCNRKKNGDIFWVSAALSPIRNARGQITHYVAIEDDITADKEIAEEIKKKEQRFRTLVANLPGTVYRCLHDDDWTMLFISDNTTELTGYPPSDFINNSTRTFNSIISTEDRQKVVDEVGKAVAKKHPWAIEYRIVRKNGDVRWVGERGRALYHEDGSVDTLDGVIVDITAEKKLAEELELARVEADAANHAKSDFLSHMSHELRTPLNGILGYSQILQRDPDVTENQKISLDSIVNCGDHLLSLINDVLDLSKIESGHIDVDKAPCDLHKIIKSVTDVVQQRAASKGVNFGVEVSPEVPKAIVTDAPKVRQILVNLLGNAVKFTDHGGVTLHVAENPKATLRFDVSDTGVGMTTEELSHIFDPFKQVEAGKAAGGTGLGLSITKRLAEVLGGTISVASEKGRGSTFTITIPLEEAPMEELAWQIDASDAEVIHYTLSPGQDITVLVIDDRETNRDILERMLTAAGFKTILADDGDTGIEALRKHNDTVAMTLMDVRMPRMNGIHAVKNIRADSSLKHHKVLAVTASVFPEFREKAITAGFDGFLGKPFRTGELMALLQKHLNAKFESATPGEPSSTSATSSEPTPEEVETISPEALEKFQAALRIKNLTALKALAANLSNDAATKAVGDSIGKMIRSFDFKGLEALAKTLKNS